MEGIIKAILEELLADIQEQNLIEKKGEAIRNYCMFMSEWRKQYGCDENEDIEEYISCRLVGVDFELNSITLEIDREIMKKGFNFGNVKVDLSSVQLR